MRGKVGDAIGGTFKSGITPAYAGKSAHLSVSAFVREGSPPPMRGKEFANGGRSKSVGITPAYAGKREVGKLDQNNY